MTLHLSSCAYLYLAKRMLINNSCFYSPVPVCLCDCLYPCLPPVPVLVCTWACLYRVWAYLYTAFLYLYLSVPVPICTCTYLYLKLSVPVAISTYTYLYLYLSVPVPICTWALISWYLASSSAQSLMTRDTFSLWVSSSRCSAYRSSTPWGGLLSKQTLNL